MKEHHHLRRRRDLPPGVHPRRPIWRRPFRDARARVSARTLADATTDLETQSRRKQRLSAACAGSREAIEERQAATTPTSAHVREHTFRERISTTVGSSEQYAVRRHKCIPIRRHSAIRMRRRSNESPMICLSGTTWPFHTGAAGVLPPDDAAASPGSAKRG